MFIVPGVETGEPQTTRSRELGGRIEQVIHDYQREHPELTRREIRAALGYSLSRSGPGGLEKRRLVALAIGVSAAAVGAFTALSSSATPIAVNAGWVVIGVIAAAGGVTIAFMRARNRD